LLGYVGRSTPNALEAKIDNKTTAITRELFVFMDKRYGSVGSISTTRR